MQRDAWDFALGRNPANGALKDQKIVLCVPASFDTTARDMTLEAARLASFVDVTLLEEPQAAVYAWIAKSNDEWRRSYCHAQRDSPVACLFAYS